MNFKVDDLLAELDDIPGVLKQKERTSNPSFAPSRPQVSNSGNTAGLGATYSAKTSPQNPPSSTAIPSSQATHAPSAQIRAHKSGAAQAAATGSHSYQSSIDTLLEDIDLPSSPPSSVANNNKKSTLAHAHTAPSQRTSGATTAKCMSLFIGGAGQSRGRNGSLVGQVLCCDSLRCTKCDFKVIWFEHKAWRDEVDYLFFRNNYPTESKLLPKLVTDQGMRSYCCQCSWTTASDHTIVDSFSGDLRWVCGGHPVS